MNKLFFAAVVSAAVGLSATATQAMPLMRDQAPSGMITQVSGGCGVGWHRGPYGHCRRDGVGPGIIVAPPVYYSGPGYYAAGPCGGRGQHRVCGVNGGCVMVCN